MTTTTNWREIFRTMDFSEFTGEGDTVKYVMMSYKKVEAFIEQVEKEAYERGHDEGRKLGERFMEECDDHGKGMSEAIKGAEQRGRDMAVDYIEKEITANKERGYVIEGAMPGILEAARTNTQS